MLAMGPFGYPLDYLVWLALYASILLHTWHFFRSSRTRRRRGYRLVLGNGLVMACMLGAVALLAESYLRFVSVGTDAFGLSLPARRWFALHVTLNSQGCRDAEWPIEKPAGVRRIAFVGDSFTYGWGVERVEDRFTNRLQARFDTPEPGRVQVMNVAKPGWGTGDQTQPVQDLIRDYRVDEIVLAYVFNDIEETIPVTPEFDPTKPPMPRWFNPEGSCLLDYLYWTLVVPRAPSVRGYHDWLAAGYADDSVWQRHEEQLAAMFQSAQEHGVTFRVVLLPFLRSGGGAFDQAGLHAQLRKFFEANRIEVLDLLPLLPPSASDEWVVSRRDAHPNAQAHAAFAEAIWKAFYESPRNEGVSGSP